MSIFDEPKIDCHNHVLDPARFPYRSDTPYRPAGQEIATFHQFERVMEAYGVRYAVMTGPNSGYASDSRCLLDAIARSRGRVKGLAVVELDISTAELARLKSEGIIGVAFNPTLMGTDYYLRCDDLLKRLADLGMWFQIQTEKDLLLPLLPLIDRTSAPLIIDHCGRPDIAAGLSQPGFQALLALGRAGRAAVKISGIAKFARTPLPYPDAEPYVRALVEAFTLDRCVWGSDWPYLKASERIDYGPLLKLVEQLFPVAAERRKLLWETPRRLFGFAETE